MGTLAESKSLPTRNLGTPNENVCMAGKVGSQTGDQRAPTCNGSIPPGNVGTLTRNGVTSTGKRRDKQ